MGSSRNAAKQVSNSPTMAKLNALRASGRLSRTRATGPLTARVMVSKPCVDMVSPASLANTCDEIALAAEAAAKGDPTGRRKGRLRGLQTAEVDERFLEPAEAGFAAARKRVPLAWLQPPANTETPASFALSTSYPHAACCARC